jgi:hypothetical protein
MPGLKPMVDDGGPAPREIGGRGTRRPRVSRSRLYLHRFLRNRGAVVGLVALALLILFALFGSLLTTYSYLDVDFAHLSSAPSPEHPFGTSGAGNDVYAQAVHGLQRSLVIALVVSAATTIRRELLDRTLIINQRHAAAVLGEYQHHYNSHRPHRTLGQAAPLRPLPRQATSETITVRRRDRLGGLLHEYQQVA